MQNLKIKNLELNGNLILAPIAGYSDVGLRYLAKKYGAAMTCTEMISAKALLYNNKKTLDLLATFRGESPKCVQLFGNDPEDFYRAIKHPALKKFDVIDINMGCPAPKIYSNKEGSYLLNDIGRAADIVRACVRATDRPITVKFRSGITEDNIVAVKMAKALEEAGASMLTIHARTKEQGYSGRADLNVAKAVVKAVKIPVVVSGDCVDRESYLNILKVTGAAGVMVARASLGSPEVFAEILGKDVKVDKKKDILKHIEILQKYFDDRFVLLTMRSHIALYLKKCGVKAEKRVPFLHYESLDEVKNGIKTIL